MNIEKMHENKVKSLDKELTLLEKKKTQMEKEVSSLQMQIDKIKKAKTQMETHYKKVLAEQEQYEKVLMEIEQGVCSSKKRKKLTEASEPIEMKKETVDEVQNASFYRY